MVKRSIAIFLWLLAAGAPAAATITLNQDFDSGSLDVDASSVNGTIVNLAPRETWLDPSYDDRYRWVSFKASGVQGLTPEFRIDEASFLGSLTDHRYVYSYDEQTWDFFDQGQSVGSEYVFKHNTAFTGDEVYVAYGLPYPVSRTQQLVASYQANPFVTPTASASSNLVLGQSPGGIDELGRLIPQSDLYGLRLTDPTAIGPKAKVVLAAGAHAGETTANYAIEGLLEFLTGPTLEASQLRGQADFYVYPQVNPDGRYAGYYRSSVENPDKDFNRFYDDPNGFTDLSQITSAMVTDTGGDVDYVIDFHSWFGPWSDENFVFATSELLESPFLQALSLREPALGMVPSSGNPGMLRIWGMSASGLNAEFGYTAELGFHAGRGIDRYLSYGESFGLALLTTLGTPASCDLNVDGTCDAADLDLLTIQGDLVAGAPASDIKFDLDGSGMLDGGDIDAWLAAAPDGQFPAFLLGDANLDGTVDGVDFLAWNGSKFTTDSYWSQGDFNGDGTTDGVDFVIWNMRKFQSAGTRQPVPEPSSTLPVMLGFLVLARHRRFPACPDPIRGFKRVR